MNASADIPKKRLILIGGGGHCRSCIDVIESAGIYAIAGILDAPDKKGENVLGYPIIGSDNDLPRFVDDSMEFLLTVGQIASPETRMILAQKIREAGGKTATVISALAHVSPHAVIGEGTIVMHGAIVNAAATTGENCIINTNALLEHDVQISAFCHVSTGVILNGGCIVGAGSFIGSGTVAREGITVQAGSFVKAMTLLK